MKLYILKGDKGDVISLFEKESILAKQCSCPMGPPGPIGPIGPKVCDYSFPLVSLFLSFMDFKF